MPVVSSPIISVERQHHDAGDIEANGSVSTSYVTHEGQEELGGAHSPFDDPGLAVRSPAGSWDARVALNPAAGRFRLTRGGGDTAVGVPAADTDHDRMNDQEAGRDEVDAPGDETYDATSPSLAMSASRQAVYGSGPPSPVLRGLDLRRGMLTENDCERGARGRRTLDQLEERDAEMELEADMAVDVDLPSPLKRKALVDRTKAGDLQGTTVTTADETETQGDQRVVVIDISSLQRPNTELGKDAFSCFPQTASLAQCIKTLKRAQHPLHLLTTLPMEQRWTITHWLAHMGITVGLGRADAVAAVWHIHENDEGEVQRVIQAVGASFYITQGTHGALGEFGHDVARPLQRVVVVQQGCDVKPDSTAHAASRSTADGSASSITKYMVGGWEQVPIAVCGSGV